MQEITTLRRLQLCEPEILNEFVRICNRHGVKYYLAGGTLLGAVRHKGWERIISGEYKQYNEKMYGGR